jgi:hypothetical protein
MNGANNEQQQAAPESRREFFRSGTRYAVLGMLAVGAAVLGRRSVTRMPNQTCINDGYCHGCTAFTGCGLPQALSAKAVAASRQSAADYPSPRDNGGSLPRSRYEESL